MWCDLLQLRYRPSAFSILPYRRVRLARRHNGGSFFVLPARYIDNVEDFDLMVSFLPSGLDQARNYPIPGCLAWRELAKENSA